MFHREHARGQSMVEFALVLPILVLLLVGFFDLGRVVLGNDALAHAAREAARYAVVHGGSPYNHCPAGPLPAGITAPAASTACPYPSPSKESIRAEARAQAKVAGSKVTVQVCYGVGCVGDTDIVGATNARGTPVTVTVHSTVTMVAGSIVGFTAFDVSNSSTMLVNH
jgi:Flp pilus assembly protein TadG